MGQTFQKQQKHQQQLEERRNSHLNEDRFQGKEWEVFLWSLICDHIQKAAKKRTVNIPMYKGLEEMVLYLQQPSEKVLERISDLLHPDSTEPEVVSVSENDIHFTFNFHGSEKEFMGFVFLDYSPKITKDNDPMMDYEPIIKHFFASNPSLFSVTIEPPNAPVVLQLILILPISAILPGSTERKDRG